MYSRLASWRQAKADRLALEQLRVRLSAFQKLLNAEELSFAIRVSARLRDHLQRRFGDVRVTWVDSDEDLQAEEKWVERLPAKMLREISDKLLTVANLIDTSRPDYAPAIATAIIAGWLEAKSIQLGSSEEVIVGEARTHANLYLSYIRILLKIVRGEPLKH